MAKRRRRRIRKSIKYSLLALLLVSVVFLLSKRVFYYLLEYSPSPAIYFPSIQEKNFIELDDASHEFTAKNIYIYNIDTQQVVYAKNAQDRIAPASLTKLFTCFVAINYLPDLSASYTVAPELYNYAIENNFSLAGFAEAEEVSAWDLLHGTMLASGAESAITLATAVSGSEEMFVEEMNKLAFSWKLKNTHFTNVVGFDSPELYSSAEDIGKFLVFALRNESFYHVFTQSRHYTDASIQHPDGFVIESTVLSKVPQEIEEGFRILGGKSGTTGDAGLCWATLAEKNGQRYIIVVMGVPFISLANPGDDQMQETLRLLRELP